MTRCLKRWGATPWNTFMQQWRCISWKEVIKMKSAFAVPLCTTAALTCFNWNRQKNAAQPFHYHALFVVAKCVLTLCMLRFNKRTRTKRKKSKRVANFCMQNAEFLSVNTFSEKNFLPPGVRQSGNAWVSWVVPSTVISSHKSKLECSGVLLKAQQNSSVLNPLVFFLTHFERRRRFSPHHFCFSPD